MDGDQFAERLAVVRKRFASKLIARIAEIDATLPELIGRGGEVPSLVYNAHRKVHDLCGIGPTLGFDATGKAARVCEQVLLQPSRGQRGLTEQELAHLKDGLAGLRAAAQIEIQSTASVPE
jgi:HPt (histidine-containing phosphotransfer) domain-containing protein